MSTLSIVLATLLAVALLEAAALFFLLRTIRFVSFLRGVIHLVEYRRFMREVRRRRADTEEKYRRFVVETEKQIEESTRRCLDGDNPTQL